MYADDKDGEHGFSVLKLLIESKLSSELLHSVPIVETQTALFSCPHKTVKLFDSLCQKGMGAYYFKLYPNISRLPQEKDEFSNLLKTCIMKELGNDAKSEKTFFLRSYKDMKESYDKYRETHYCWENPMFYFMAPKKSAKKIKRFINRNKQEDSASIKTYLGAICADMLRETGNEWNEFPQEVQVPQTLPQESSLVSSLATCISQGMPIQVSSSQVGNKPEKLPSVASTPHRGFGELPLVASAPNRGSSELFHDTSPTDCVMYPEKDEFVSI